MASCRAARSLDGGGAIQWEARRRLFMVSTVTRIDGPGNPDHGLRRR